MKVPTQTFYASGIEINIFTNEVKDMKKTSKKGFTLMEMLIVIAIIAILIAIAIPVFTAQLNKAKKGTDQSNARSLKSLVTTAYLTSEGNPLVTDEAKVYYMHKDANKILTSTSDALKCEGSGDGYATRTGADSSYIWVYWDGTAVTETNPSLDATTATTT